MILAMAYGSKINRFLLLVMCVVTQQIDGRISRRKSRYTKEERLAKKYLSIYGYMNFAQTNLKEAVTNFQRFAGLNVNGEVTKALLDKITQTRCGLSDMEQDGEFRLKEYYLHSSSFKKQPITWSLAKSSGNKDTISQLSRDDIHAIITEAFQMWHAASQKLIFVEKSDTDADVKISFEKNIHFDPFPFDGPGGVIGHSFYPRREGLGFYGDVHLDDGDVFTIKPTYDSKAIHLFWAIVHQIGHSLGLMHSHDRNSIMYPWYNKRNPILRLDENDIKAIQEKYSGLKREGTKPSGYVTKRGTPTQETITLSPNKTFIPTSTKTKLKSKLKSFFKSTVAAIVTTFKPKTIAVDTTAVTKVSPTVKKTRAHTIAPTKRITSTTFVPKKPCPVLPIQAIIDYPRISHQAFISGSKDLYFFDRKGIKYGPMKLTNYYPAFKRKPIDATFTMRRGSGDITVIFTGSYYYIFRLFSFISGPHHFYGKENYEELTNPLNFRFPNWIKKIDSAMRWYPNKKVYIFADAYFWKYDDKQLGFYPNYPRYTRTVWRNLPRYVDASHSSKEEERTFFISGNMIYLLDDRLLEVAQGFPKPIGEAWLNCGDSRKSHFVHPTLSRHIRGVRREP